ncbi:alpha/beta hydrolase family protein [Tenacibaculum insulae]|uniref:alpha/beta hydrolase family protein n=1 Tax=Tenacibaculum insulae TaxID=2029677 RepID=UPI003AB22C01
MTRIITYLMFYILSNTFSYAQKVTSEEILIKNDGVELPGTLTFTKEKSPLLIWVHGSGAVLRDGGKPQYIKQFREAVNQENIAFFSYDKRSANKNNLVFLQQGVLFNDFVSDAKKVVNHFKDDKRFSKIILVGHSQGSLISMLISKNVAKYISLAGPGETIDKTLIRQITKQSAEFGKITEAHIKELKETGNIKNVNPNLMSLFAPQNQPFFKEWISLNPLEEIKKITIPTLIINGDKDFQVLVNDAKALHNANQKSKLVIIPNMNHLGKHIEKDEDNMKSYTNPDFPISKKLINTVVTFVKK